MVNHCLKCGDALPAGAVGFCCSCVLKFTPEELMPKGHTQPGDWEFYFDNGTRQFEANKVKPSPPLWVSLPPVVTPPGVTGTITIGPAEGSSAPPPPVRAILTPENMEALAEAVARKAYPWGPRSDRGSVRDHIELWAGPSPARCRILAALDSVMLLADLLIAPELHGLNDLQVARRRVAEAANKIGDALMAAYDAAHKDDGAAS